VLGEDLTQLRNSVVIWLILWAEIVYRLLVVLDALLSVVALDCEDEVALLRILPIQLIDVEVQLSGDSSDLVVLVSGEVVTVVVELGLDATALGSVASRVRTLLRGSHVQMRYVVMGGYLGTRCRRQLRIGRAGRCRDKPVVVAG